MQRCKLFKPCWNLPAGTELQWCRMFKWCLNLPAGTVLQGCRLFKLCWNLTANTVLQWCRLCSGVATYLSAVLQWCRLFKRCRNLLAGHCAAVVQAVSVASEPTCSALCCSGAGCVAVLQPTCRHCVAVVQAA